MFFKFDQFFVNSMPFSLPALIFDSDQNLNEKLERVERLGEGVQEGKR